jgi:Uma2 family endonuclease
LLGNAVRSHGLGHVLGSSQGFELPTGDVIQCDGSFVSNERWQSAPKPVPDAFLQVVPDLVVEILSEATAARDRGEKKGIYERNGVREYWIVDWRSRTLTVFHLHEGRFGISERLAETDRMRSRVLPELEIPIDSLF